MSRKLNKEEAKVAKNIKPHENTLGQHNAASFEIHNENDRDSVQLSNSNNSPIKLEEL